MLVLLKFLNNSFVFKPTDSKTELYWSLSGTQKTYAKILKCAFLNWHCCLVSSWC